MQRVDSANTGFAPHCHTAFAVAMNDSDGTMTSSPGPTPDAYNARWRRRCAARCGNGIGSSDSRRKRLLELTHARALRHPARGNHLGDGRALLASEVRPRERDLHHQAAASVCAFRPLALGPPPLDQACETLLEAHLGLEPEALPGAAGVREPPRNLVHRALGAELTVSGDPITCSSCAASSARLVSSPLAMLNTSSVTSAVAAKMLARAMSST